MTQLTFKTIESLKPHVKLVDSDDNLSLYSYNTCEEGMENYDTIKRCRGVVFDKNRNLFFQSYTYSPEYSLDTDREKLQNLFSPNTLYYESFEGTIIRVFFYEKWYVSTHRKLDAYKSKWASKNSFGKLFEQAIETMVDILPDFYEMLTNASEGTAMDRFLDCLDKDKQYVFLLSPTDENVIVSSGRYPVYHVGTFQNSKYVVQHLHLPVPSTFKFESFEEFEEYLTFQENHLHLQGLMALNTDTNYKVFTNSYAYYYGLRGNTPSIKFRYLEIRMAMDKRSDFMEMYPSYKEYFEKYEDTLFLIAKEIKNYYFNRYSKRDFETLVPKEFFGVVKKCHQFYKESGQKITLNKVIEILNQENPTKLNQLIRFMNTSS